MVALISVVDKPPFSHYHSGMDKKVVAYAIKEGGNLITQGIRLLIARPKGGSTSLEVSTAAVNVDEVPKPPAPAPAYSHTAIALPTREETNLELKRRLARELYRAELDLANGLKIAGKPCDCLSNKHTLGLEAMAEELLSADPGNPVYNDVISWIGNNQSKLTIEAIQSGKYAQQYPRMASEFKDFRKRILGSDALKPMAEKPSSMSLEEAKKIAADRAAKEVERQWSSPTKT
jgi:hypothetical protein